jgi:hypothetical protein
MRNPDFDYSDVYRKEEMKKLKTRIKKTRNILFICAISIIAGALLFWKMEIPAFTVKTVLKYLFLSVVIACLGFLCEKRPYLALISALIICIGFWTVEIIIFESDNLFIAGLAQKIFIISLLSFALNNSREAELLRKELLFS